MGFITSSVLAQGNHPAFLVEAHRVSVRQEPQDGANRVGVLKLGDIAVADEDTLETWPWVLIPAGSKVRDAIDTDVLVDLQEDAFLRVEKTLDEQSHIATRCPEGSAAVHLCICRCQHWRVNYKQVFVRQLPFEDARVLRKVLKGDLLCVGQAVSSKSPEERDKRWAHFGPDAALWSSTAGLNRAPEPLLRKGSMEACIMKEHAEFGKLLTLVRQRQEGQGAEREAVCPRGHMLVKFPTDAGFPCDACGQEAAAGSSMWGCHKRDSKAATVCSYDVCEKCRRKAAGASDQTALGPAGAAGDAKGAPGEAGAEGKASGDSPSSSGKPEEEEPWWAKWLRMNPEADHQRGAGASEQLALGMSELALRRWDLQPERGEERQERAEHEPERSRAWLVLPGQSSGARTLDDAEGQLLLELQPWDVLVSMSSGAAPCLASGLHAAGMWLALRTGDRIVRQGELLATVTAKPVYVQACLEDGSESLRPWDFLDARHVCVQAVGGFGAPWAVAHRQVPVRNSPSTEALPLGLCCKGDIVGVHAERGDWVHLAPNTDSRAKQGSIARPTHDVQNHVTGGQAEVKASLWMLTRHKTLGRLMQRLGDEEPCSLGTPGLLLNCARRGIYRRVTELCHRRIWREHLDDLWEGEVSKLPPIETLEAKLFRDNVDVLHARLGGQFKGGALIEGFRIHVQQDKDSPQWVGASAAKASKAPAQGAGRPGAKPGGDGPREEADAEEWAARTASAPIGYIHCLATEPQSRLGKPLWGEVRRLAAARDFVFVACHSILLPPTLDFWRACGMKRVDPEDGHDRSLFKSQVNVRSQGALNLEVDDLVEALPRSALPLFIWENPAALEAWSVSAERPEQEEEEVSDLVDKKLKRELARMRHHQRLR